MAVLKIEESILRMLASAVVQRMSGGEFVAKRAIAFMHETGRDMIRANIKLDDKPATLDFAERASEVCVARSRWQVRVLAPTRAPVIGCGGESSW